MAGRLFLSTLSWALNLNTAPLSSGPVSTLDRDVSAIRLPDDIRPLHYDLAIRTDLEDKRFYGAEVISVEVAKRTNEIKFHADCNLDIDLLQVCLTNALCLELGDKGYSRDCHARTLTIPLLVLRDLNVGDQFDLVLRWSSNLTSEGNGYMLSPDVGFETPGYSAVTRFEPVEARAAFPSWDQPSPKANWTMTLISRTATVNLANMDVESEVVLEAGTKQTKVENLLLRSAIMDGSWKTTRFHTTPKMSPNNVAWGNGRFNKMDSSFFSELRGEEVPTAVYANYENVTGQSYLLDVLTRVTPLYEKMFNLGYPLPKLYWMATPAYRGGIEHWGLITGGSESTVWSEDRGDSKKTGITSFVAHETAHQWFANIVTMSTWDDLWLNEAFASYAADVLAGPRLQSDFATWQPFNDKSFEPSMKLDATASHAIITEIVEESQFGSAFDSITYLKGASVLRMIAEVVGEDTFIKGVSKYLEKFAYQNAEGKDLWNEVSSLTDDFDVTYFADAWTKQPGFPVVHVEKVQPGLFLLTQRRYFTRGGARAANNSQIWPVPLFAIPGGQQSTVMYDNATFVQLPTDDQLVINRDRLGYYRVHYDQSGTDYMRDALHSRQLLSGTDRAGYIYDVAAFAKSGLSKTTDVLDLLSGIDAEGEEDVSVWNAVVNFLTEMRLLLGDQPIEVRNKFDAFARDILLPVYRRVGLVGDRGESAVVGRTRMVILSLAGKVGVPEAVVASRKAFAKISHGGSDGLPDTTLKAVIETAVQHGDEATWRRALSISQNNTGHLAPFALAALGQSQNIDQIHELLHLLDNNTLTNDFSAKQTLLASAMSNPIAKEVTLDWITHNIPKVFSKTVGITMNGVFTNIFSPLSTYHDVETLQKAFEAYPDWTAGLESVLEVIETSADWLKRDLKDILTYLK